MTTPLKLVTSGERLESPVLHAPFRLALRSRDALNLPSTASRIA